MVHPIYPVLAQPELKSYAPFETHKLNYFQALNEAMSTILDTDQSACIFGEDVGFGGVFVRSACSRLIALALHHGTGRTPRS